MRRILTFVLVLACCAGTVFAKDVLYLKNGSIIKGNLVELIPSGDVKFTTSDGSVFVYPAKDVTMLEKESQDSQQKDVLYLTNGSIIKGYFKEIKMTGKVSFETSDGSLFVYPITEVKKMDKTEVKAQAQQQSNSYNRTQGRNYTQNQSYNRTQNYAGASQSNYTRKGGRTADESRHVAPEGFRAFVNFVPAKGFVLEDWGYGYSWGLSATIGRQFNKSFFLGGGIGFDMLVDENSYSYDYMIPFYAAIKGNVGERVAQFTYGARMGFAVCEDSYYNYDDYYYGYDYDVTASFYLNLSVGLRLGFTPNFALNITPEVDIYAGGYTNVGIGLRLGFEF